MNLLTPAQENQIPLYRDKWVKIGMCNDPMDLPNAIKHLSKAYEKAGLKIPAAFLSYGSPIAGSYVSAYLKRHHCDSFMRVVRLIQHRFAYTYEEMRSILLEHEGESHDSKFRSNILKYERDLLFSKVVLDRAREVVDPTLARNELSNAMFGQHEAGWLGFYEALRDFGVRECNRLTPMIEFAKCAGWSWTYDEVAIITDRPEVFVLDDAGRPHCETGPALKYRDGVVLYALHGVTVPKLIVEEPHLITPEMIEAEANVEVRRSMLDRYGWSRYLLDTNSEVIDEITEESASKVQDIRLANLYRNGLRGARLYRKTLPGDEPLVMIQLINSSPEPDGTYKPYLLRVPPKMKTCLEAVAWVNWKTADDYRPIMET
jgi:hypothetical protein